MCHCVEEETSYRGVSDIFSPATVAQWWLARASGGKLVGLMELPQGQPNCNYRP